MDRRTSCAAGSAARSSTTLGRIALAIAASLPAIVYAASGPCGDPWINQAFEQMYHRAPIGSGKNVGDCDITRYGNGHWSTYQDLTTKIAQRQGAQTNSGGGRLVGGGNMSGGSVIGGSSALSGGGLVGSNNGNNTGNKPLLGSSGMGTGGASVINTNGSNIVAQGGGNFKQPISNIINQDGNGFRTLSVDKPRAATGKYLVIPGGNLVDANGNVVRQAGSYALVARSGGFAVGTGAGARAPTAGTVVIP